MCQAYGKLRYIYIIVMRIRIWKCKSKMFESEFFNKEERTEICKSLSGVLFAEYEEDEEEKEE